MPSQASLQCHVLFHCFLQDPCQDMWIVVWGTPPGVTSYVSIWSSMNDYQEYFVLQSYAWSKVKSNIYCTSTNSLTIWTFCFQTFLWPQQRWGSREALAALKPSRRERCLHITGNFYITIKTFLPLSADDILPIFKVIVHLTCGSAFSSSEGW